MQHINNDVLKTSQLTNNIQTTSCSGTLKPTAIVGKKRNSLKWNTAINNTNERYAPEAAATKGKMKLPSISGGYSTGDSFLDDWIDAI